MNTPKAPLILSATFLLVGNAWADPIQDPITDYLSLQVPDWSEFVDTLEFIERVEIDIDEDGIDETFIGTCYRYSARNEADCWSARRKAQGVYQHISLPNQDAHIASFEDTYICAINEKSKQWIFT